MNHLLKLLTLISLITTIFTYKNRAHVLNTNLTLYWDFIDHDTAIDVKIQWKQYSFFALMINSKMIQTDLWVCSCENQATQLWSMNDQWTLDHKFPQNDTHYDGTDDFLTKEAINDTESSTITCRFTRKLNTGDQYDKPLKKGQTLIITAINSSTTNMKKHHGTLFFFKWSLVDNFNKDVPKYNSPPIDQGIDWELIHGIVLSVCWGLLADFGLIFARYMKLMKFYTLAHAVMFFTINILSIPAVIYLIYLNFDKIIHRFGKMQIYKKMHTVIGISFLIMIIIQHVFGIILKYKQQKTQGKAIKYLIMRKLHTISGYTIYFLSKAEILIGWWTYTDQINAVFIALLVWFITLFILRGIFQILYKSGRLMFLLKWFKFKQQDSAKIASSTQSLLESVLQDQPNSSNPQTFMQAINSNKTKAYIKFTYPKIKYVQFKNMICNLSNFTHPGGQSLIESVIGDQVSKYIYGGASVEGNQTKHHKHSDYVIKYLQQNVIGVKQQNLIQIQYQQLWETKDIKQVSPHFFKFTFTNRTLKLDANPQDILKYFGKFLLVSTKNNNKYITRTYTLLLSQLQTNIIYRNRLLKSYKQNFQTNFQAIRKSQSNQLVLMIKRYQSGNVSKQVHKGIAKIQGLYGIGLELEAGLNVIITGGSGILPFIDLFDTLLRKALLKVAEIQKAGVGKYNIYNMEYNKVLIDCSFKLYASFMTIQQFQNNYSWLIDLAQISKKYNLNLFQLNLKFPQNKNLGQDIKMFDENINAQFLRQKIRNADKYYCCGPPIMNQSLYEAFIEVGYDKQKFRIL